MTGATPVWDPYFIETSEGSFSALSTPLIARERDRNNILRNSLSDTCDDGTFRPANEVETFITKITSLPKHIIHLIVISSNYNIMYT